MTGQISKIFSGEMICPRLLHSLSTSTTSFSGTTKEERGTTVKTRTTRRVALLAVVLCGVFVGSAAARSTGTPSILPPESHPYGKSYGEWSARHWQWLYSLPVDH